MNIKQKFIEDEEIIASLEKAVYDEYMKVFIRLKELHAVEDYDVETSLNNSANDIIAKLSELLEVINKFNIEDGSDDELQQYRVTIERAMKNHVESVVRRNITLDVMGGNELLEHYDEHARIN